MSFCSTWEVNCLHVFLNMLPAIYLFVCTDCFVNGKRSQVGCEPVSRIRLVVWILSAIIEVCFTEFGEFRHTTSLLPLCSLLCLVLCLVSMGCTCFMCCFYYWTYSWKCTVNRTQRSKAVVLMGLELHTVKLCAALNKIKSSVKDCPCCLLSEMAVGVLKSFAIQNFKHCVQF